MSNSDLKTGIDLVTKATEHDTNHRYQEAAYLYNLGLQYFTKAAQSEYNEQTKGIISQKMSQYSARLQQINEHIQRKSLTPSATATISNTTPKTQSSDVPIPSFEPAFANLTINPKANSQTSSSSSTSSSGGTLPKNLELVSSPPQVDWGALQKAEKEKTREMVSAPPAIDWSSLQQAEKAKRSSQAITHGESRGDIFGDLDKAMKVIEKASEEENQRNYEAALESYKRALDYFLSAIEHETNPEIKKAISDKIELYVSRAELIKDAIRGKSGGTSSTRSLPRSSVGSLPKQPPKAPVKAEVSATAKGFVEEAIKVATEAVEEDESFRYDEAIEKYEQAMQLFTAALKNETNEQVLAIIKQKMVDYNLRIEQLKQYKATGAYVPNPIKLAVKPGEKYQAPDLAKKGSSGGLFGKKEKKTWEKF